MHRIGHALAALRELLPRLRERFLHQLVVVAAELLAESPVNDPEDQLDSSRSTHDPGCSMSSSWQKLLGLGLLRPIANFCKPRPATLRRIRADTAAAEIAANRYHETRKKISGIFRSMFRLRGENLACEHRSHAPSN